jgi:hypothetical protein
MRMILISTAAYAIDKGRRGAFSGAMTKPSASKSKKLKNTEGAPKRCCGTLSLIAEVRGAKRPEPLGRRIPPGDLTMVSRKHAAVI